MKKITLVVQKEDTKKMMSYRENGEGYYDISKADTIQIDVSEIRAIIFNSRSGQMKNPYPNFQLITSDRIYVVLFDRRDFWKKFLFFWKKKLVNLSEDHPKVTLRKIDALFFKTDNPSEYNMIYSLSGKEHKDKLNGGRIRYKSKLTKEDFFKLVSGN